VLPGKKERERENKKWETCSEREGFRHSLVFLHLLPDEVVLPVILIVNLMGILLEDVGVGVQEDLLQSEEVAVVTVVNFHDTPRVLPPTNLLAVDLVGLHAANKGKGELVL